MSASKNKRKPLCVLLRLSTFYLCEGTEDWDLLAAAVWDFSIFYENKKLWWKVSSGGDARVGQEAKSECKVSGVRQMLVRWTVDRMCVCVCPFMVFLRKTVAGHVAPMSSDPSGFAEIGLWFVVGNKKKKTGIPQSHTLQRLISTNLHWFILHTATSDSRPSYCSCLWLLKGYIL